MRRWWVGWPEQRSLAGIMTILHVPPESPVWISAGADTILFLHIAGGSLAIASSAVALLSQKGERVYG